MLNAVTDPLHRFPVFRTSDPEELRELSTTLFGAAGIDLKNTDGFEARVNLIKLQETGLAFGATTADLVIDNLCRRLHPAADRAQGPRRHFCRGPDDRHQRTSVRDRAGGQPLADGLRGRP